MQLLKGKKLEKKGGKDEKENLQLNLPPLTFASPKIYQYASKLNPYRFQRLGKLLEVLCEYYHGLLEHMYSSSS